MTRVLHILSQRPGRSGSGVFLAAMVREAGRRGYEQHAIVAGPSNTTAAELPPLRDDQLSTIVFPSDDAPFPVPGNSDVMPYPTTVFSRMTETEVEQYLAVSRRVMERVRDEFRPDVVHAHHLWLMTALARDVFDGIPMIATSHNAELRQMIKAPHLAPRVKPGVKNIDKVCVLTPQSIDDTIQTFNVDEQKIALTGAGYDEDLFGQRTTGNGQRRAAATYELHWFLSRRMFGTIVASLVCIGAAKLALMNNDVHSAAAIARVSSLFAAIAAMIVALETGRLDAESRPFRLIERTLPRTARVSLLRTTAVATLFIAPAAIVAAALSPIAMLTALVANAMLFLIARSKGSAGWAGSFAALFAALQPIVVLVAMIAAIVVLIRGLEARERTSDA